jgi:molecular chaperone GrpE
MEATSEKAISPEAEPITPQDGEMDAMASMMEALKQATSMMTPEATLEARIAEVEKQSAEYRDQALRTAAELENTRKRAEREKQEANKFAITNFAKDLVSVFENLSRASASISAEARATDATINNLAMGVELTLNELSRVFDKYQIQRIDPMGEPFDHNFHQAMMKIETNEHPEGTVVQVLQAAYVLHDRLLQPAFVGVATTPASSASPTQGASHHVDTQA